MQTLRKIFIIILIAALLVSVSSLTQSRYSIANATNLRIIGGGGKNTLVSNFAADNQTQALISQVSSGVVSIFGYKRVVEPNSGLDNLFLNFLREGEPPLTQTSVQNVEVTAGTGFFVDPDGYILTNNHVVADPSVSYQVNLPDGSQVNSEVVYRDPVEDLALLKINGQNFTTLPLGDSSQIKVGEPVLTMGNAFGLMDNLVSKGAISALHRQILASEEGSDSNGQTMSDIIETSAQLYPGDSGGPTFDTTGKVIGINVAMAVDSPGVSFSIPINYAKVALANALRESSQ